MVIYVKFLIYKKYQYFSVLSLLIIIIIFFVKTFCCLGMSVCFFFQLWHFFFCFMFVCDWFLELEQCSTVNNLHYKFYSYITSIYFHNEIHLNRLTCFFFLLLFFFFFFVLAAHECVCRCFTKKNLFFFWGIRSLVNVMSIDIFTHLRWHIRDVKFFSLICCLFRIGIHPLEPIDLHWTGIDYYLLMVQLAHLPLLHC